MKFRKNSKCLFDRHKLEDHQEFMARQDKRKRYLGKPEYLEGKFWEEMEELKIEIIESQKSLSEHNANYKKITHNFINEFGDLLFCLLGNEERAKALRARLQLLQERAQAHRRDDLIKKRHRPEGGMSHY